MSTTIESITNYEFTIGERLFFDTNIWILLHSPRLGLDKRGLAYSRAHHRIQEAGSEVWCTSFVLSEFVQAYATRTWRSRPNKKIHPEYKIFRQDKAAFGFVYEEIQDAVNQILKNATVVDFTLEVSTVLSLLSRFGEGNAEMTDLLVAEFCREHSLVLVTDDIDFSSLGVPILTHNERLLAHSGVDL